ncbi:MAG TPA: methyltransferase domain-containing protein [Anaerolineae bacterium]|nr:methyltransferase domain-containing protein [Anaerolineae bacterium]
MPINKEGTIHCYNAVAPLYSFFRKITHKSDNEIMPFVLNVLDPADGDTVLDAGTGPGIYAIKIAEKARDARIHGVDLSPNFLKLAERNAREAGFDHIEFAQGDLESLPFDDGHFDKLVCAGVISAVPDREKAAREIYRVVKHGGRALITEPNKGRDIRDRAFLLLLYIMGAINPKLRGFSAKDISRYYFNQDSFYSLFKKAGFDAVRVVERAGSMCAVCFK